MQKENQLRLQGDRRIFCIKQVQLPLKYEVKQMKSEVFTCDMGEEPDALRVVLTGHFICMTARQYKN
jgi:hypothetical protein